jgi:hypothetical protein
MTDCVIGLPGVIVARVDGAAFHDRRTVHGGGARDQLVRPPQWSGTTSSVRLMCGESQWIMTLGGCQYTTATGLADNKWC